MDGDRICERLQQLTSEGALFDDLLLAAVEMMHEANEHFHWTGIYELFPDSVLRLGPFVGSPTDHVFISVGRGICGSAVAEGCNKVIPDVTKEENYLACSSSTRSELVVLIRTGANIFAQIDIDSNEYDAFDQETVTEVQKVADWLAEAYQCRQNSAQLKWR